MTDQTWLIFKKLLCMHAFLYITETDSVYVTTYVLILTILLFFTK